MPQSDSRDDLIRTLLRPEALPWRLSMVELIETHESCLTILSISEIAVTSPCPTKSEKIAVSTALRNDDDWWQNHRDRSKAFELDA